MLRALGATRWLLEGLSLALGLGWAGERWVRWGRRASGWDWGPRHAAGTPAGPGTCGAATHRSRWHQIGCSGAHPHTGFGPGDVGPSQLSGEERGRDRCGWEHPQGSAHLEAHVLPSGTRKGPSLQQELPCCPHLASSQTQPPPRARKPLPPPPPPLLKAEVLGKPFLKVTQGQGGERPYSSAERYRRCAGWPASSQRFPAGPATTVPHSTSLSFIFCVCASFF